MLKVSAEETEIFEEIKSLLGENEDKVSQFIAPFPLLSKNAVESLRYRAEVKFSSIIFVLKDSSMTFNSHCVISINWEPSRVRSVSPSPSCSELCEVEGIK